MIILPPEDKKPSPILKWIFRLLMIVVIIGGLLIFALNILSGTSESHKRGLEQAFSDIFKTSVTIGTLKEFNIFPLFNLEMENVRAPYGPAGGEVRVERVVLVFRFFDLLFGRDLIKDLQISNLTMTPDIIGTYGLRIESAGIVTPKAQEVSPSFKLKGEYGEIPIGLSLNLQMLGGGVQPVYRIANNLPAEIVFGKLGVSGKFVQNEKGEPSIKNASFNLDNSEVATGAVTILTSEPVFGMQVDFLNQHSKGTVKTHTNPSAQVWDFEKLDLSEVVSDKPTWAAISNAVNEFAPRATTAKEESSSTHIDVTIKSLTGNISGENLRGSFILSPDNFIGWWDGVITTSSSKRQNVPASGVIQCGLLSLSPKGSVWGTEKAHVFIDPASILAKLMIDSVTGKIEWSIERVASGAPTAFDDDLKAYKDMKAALRFPEAHTCLSYIEKFSAP